MSTSDGGGTTRTSPSYREGAPANSYKGPKIDASSQQNTFADDPDDQFDKLKRKHADCLLNKDKFFPELLAWRKVVEKLKMKADIDNCYNASPFFGDLLREKREKEVVLPKVFGILAQRYGDRNQKDESYRERNVKSIPWRRRYHSQPTRMTPIWKCRLVSKKWNGAIEDCFRNEDAGHYQMEHDFDNAENEQAALTWGTHRFCTESNVTAFLRHFKATHYDDSRQLSRKCPFLGRFVQVDSKYVENTQAYFNKLKQMFDNFGVHVWYFRFVWFQNKSADELVYIYQNVKQFVELMPNLKVLRIENAGYPQYPKEAQQALEEEIERNPFPEGTNLEMISVNRIPAVFFNQLVHQNRQISRLEVRSEFSDTDNCTLFVNKLPNLNQLSLLGVDPRIFLDALEAYPTTLNLEKFIFQCELDFPFVSWSRVFSIIGSKINPVSCTDLQLKMPSPRSDAEIMSVLQDSLECRLKLENIQRCKVFSFDRLCMDFLLPSKNSLREITLHSCPDFEDAMEKELGGQQVVKFLGYKNKMEQSNVAKEFPRLRKLRVDFYWLKVSRYYSIQPSRQVKFEKETKLYF